jgi:signal transduction histidine kinase
MKLRSLLEATLGRRVLVRVWLHCFALLVFVMILVPVAVFRAGHRSRNDPIGQVAVALAERPLALRNNPAALEAELSTLRTNLRQEVSVYRADDSLVGTSRVPAFAPLTATERATLASRGSIAASKDIGPGRFVAGAFEGDRLVAYAITTRPPPPFLAELPVIFLSGTVLGLVAVSVSLARSIVKPIENLARLSSELGGGNLGVRARDDRRDEIGDLARAFNDMATRVQRLRNAERELLADVSHELRTPLARMRVVVELASKQNPEKIRAYLGEISIDLSELEQLLADVFSSTRLDLDKSQWDEARPLLHCRIIEVGSLVKAAAARFLERWPSRAIDWRMSGEDFAVNGDPVLLRRALENLLDNARKYSNENESIAVEVCRTEIGGAAAVEIAVVDHGIGIAPADQEHVFTAFFRADKSRARATGGVGLGLTLALRIVEAHAGAVGVSSQPNRGSRFWFALPLAPREAARPISHETAPGSLG